jgi:hypothetical protein
MSCLGRNYLCDSPTQTSRRTSRKNYWIVRKLTSMWAMSELKEMKWPTVWSTLIHKNAN